MESCKSKTTPMAASDLNLTIGEVNLRVKVPRFCHWILAVSWVFFNLTGAATLAYGFYSDPSREIKTISLWPGLVIMFWGVYISLVSVVYMYMTLYTPHASFALREAVFNVGLGRIGFPAGFITYLVVYFGQSPWMLYTLAAIFPVLMAGVIAFWVCLVKTYVKK